MTSRSWRKVVVWLSLVIASGGLSEAFAAPFTVGYFDLPPHTAASSGDNPPGAAQAYFRLIAKRMGLTDISFIRYPLPRLLLMPEPGVELYSVFSPVTGKQYLGAYEQALSDEQAVSRYEDFLQQH